MLTLQAEDEAEALDVGFGELPVAGLRAFGLDQPFALEEADLRDGDVREGVFQDVQYLTDREVRPPGLERHGSSFERNKSLNLPI